MEMNIYAGDLEELTIDSPLERIACHQQNREPLHPMTLRMRHHLQQRLLLSHPSDLWHVDGVLFKLRLNLSFNYWRMPRHTLLRKNTRHLQMTNV